MNWSEKYSNSDFNKIQIKKSKEELEIFKEVIEKQGLKQYHVGNTLIDMFIEGYRKGYKLHEIKGAIEMLPNMYGGE